MKRSLFGLMLVVASAALAQATSSPTPVLEELGVSASTAKHPEVPFVPTPDDTVDAMLKLAGVGPKDVVYDLGSGDGRIVIRAVKKYGARHGVGVDINPVRVKEAEENARQAGVQDKVEFREGDLFKADIKDATVVTLYLLQSVNERLRPKLLSELKPGTRIVSQTFDMGDWKPDKTVEVGHTTVYLWTVPQGGMGVGGSGEPAAR